MKKVILLISFLILITVLSGCIESESYSCSYESRRTGCGGKGWSTWESECFEFNMDDYKDEWTPQMVCKKYTGSDTSCGGSCCVYIEYRDNSLSTNGC